MRAVWRCSINILLQFLVFSVLLDRSTTKRMCIPPASWMPLSNALNTPTEHWLRTHSGLQYWCFFIAVWQNWCFGITAVGESVGSFVGALLGSDDGCSLGALLGSDDGCALGALLGSDDAGAVLPYSRRFLGWLWVILFDLILLHRS